MDSLIGKRLGQYEILSKLGSGGMANVYRARQTSVDRDVALKVIRTDLTEDAAFMERFAREARTIASLSHLHILKVFDYGQQDGIAYLVMELLEGGSLNTLIQKTGALSLTTTARVLKQISGALDYAHDKGIVHRDLKSDNVLLDTAENAYLTDFGIARLVNDNSKMTQTGTIMGTPAYMAPELWTGKAADKQADIYALGVIVYEMITGKTPFTGDTPFVVMYQHLNEIPPVDDLEQDLSEAVQEVLLKAMAKKPEDRYLSAGALANAFDEALGGISDTTHGMPTRTSAKNVEVDFGPPTEKLTVTPPPTKANKATIAEKLPTIPPTAVVVPPKSSGRLGWIVSAGVAILVILALLVYPQVQRQQADVVNTAQAMVATQTEAARPTETATATITPSITPTPNPTDTAEPTEELVDTLSFDTYTNAGLNIAFRYPAGWEVKVVQGVSIFVTKNFSKLDFSNPAKGITGAPYVQIIVGDAETLGVLDLKKANTPEDALLTYLGLDRVTNLDRVQGTRFPAATTRRVKPELGMVRHVYGLILGENRFAIAMLQTGPRVSDAYNDRVMLPLIRSFDNYTQITPTTVISPTPEPTVFFPTPSAFSTKTISGIGLQFSYPQGWSAVAEDSGASVMPFENVKQLDKFSLDDFNRPYQVFMRFDGEEFISVQGKVGIETLFADNYASYTIDAKPLYDAPFPTVYARAGEKLVLGVAVRGWVALVKVRDDLYVTIFAHAGAGREDAFLSGVLLPMLKSFKDVAGTPSAESTAIPTLAQSSGGLIR